MNKKIKKFNFWLRRKSHLPVVVIGSAVVLVLYFNEDTSITKNMEYQKEIRSLSEEIQACRDSADYYRRQREALLTGTEELECLARERYHMQNPTEDVYVVK